MARTGTAAAETATDYQQWLVLNAEANMDPVLKGLRMSLNTESRLLDTPRRTPDKNGGVEEQNPNTVFILRPAVGYQVASWITAWLGYCWQPIFYRNELREDVMEHRLFWQANGSWKFGPVQVGYRTRLEHRYRATGDSGTTHQGEGEWAHRFRQQVRVAWTLAEGQPWMLIVYDELFLHLNKTNYATEPGLDQNRIFAGVGYEPSPEARFELGYLNQAVHRFTDREQMNHVLWMSLNFKLGGRHAHAAPVRPAAPAVEPAASAPTGTPEPMVPH
jgi:hypothetical protein